MDNVTKNMIRSGRISSINPGNGTARVTFADKDGLVSNDLPILQRQTLKNKDFSMPDIGESVVCVFQPNGLAEGFILGAHYNEEDKPPGSNPDIRQVTFEDGTMVSYNRSSHVLDINCGSGTVNIVAAGNVNVTGDVIADGISLKTHTHPESIGSVTGPPG